MGSPSGHLSPSSSGPSSPTVQYGMGGVPPAMGSPPGWTAVPPPAVGSPPGQALPTQCSQLFTGPCSVSFNHH